MNAPLITPDRSIDTTSAGEELRRNCAAVRLHVKSLGSCKTLSPGQVNDLIGETQVDARMLKASKKLLDSNHPTVKLLGRIRSRILTTWRTMTLPFTEAGVRLMARPQIPEFEQRMGLLQEELAAAVSELETVWPALVEAARERLGDLFNPEDYPASLEGLFSVEWSYPEVSVPTYLLRIDPDLYQREQCRVTQRFDRAVELAEQAVIGEFANLVNHLTERLSDDRPGERKVFRDSSLENLRDFFAKFRQLPLRGSAEEQLEELITQAQGILGGVRPKDLRNSEALRQQVATHLAQVGESLEAMLVPKPRRRIVRLGGAE